MFEVYQIGFCESRPIRKAKGYIGEVYWCGLDYFAGYGGV